MASPLSLETSLLANSTAISQPTLAAPPTTSTLPPPSAPASPPPLSSPPASPPPLSPPPASPPPTPPAAAASPPPNLSPPPLSPPPAASTSPPPSFPPPTPPQPSPPPPPNESPPQSPPPSPPIEPPKAPSTSPPPFSPPPQSQSSPPPANQESPPTSPPPPASTSTPVTPPPPSGATTPTTPLPVLFSPPPPNSITNQPATPQLPGTGTPSYPTPSSSHSAPAQKSPPTNASAGGSNASSNSSPGIGIIVGVAVGAGVVAVLIAVICVLLLKRKKRQPYYIDPGHPPKAGEPYFNASTNWNSQMEHIIKISPPPGLMATPVGAAAGVWGTPPPPPPAANSSSEYTSNSCQHQQHFGPISPGAGSVMGGGGGGTLGGFSKFQFSYEELAAATGGFSQANLLGQGGFGYVHKGVLPDGKEVAIKSLKDGSGQGEREFQAEVEIISRVHHRHLVSLVGYCIVENQRMLVYEFVPNKTLEFHLHGKGQPVMDWGTRLKIALGSAKGLAYLHEDCHPRIIHRDIKAANILLDDKNEAMVADFGLAKLTSDNLTHVSTRVMGTFGYLAPEYASSGKLTEKSDVFSFGVMLLELITGKRPVDSTNMYMEDSLVDWARPRLAKALEDGNYDELADSRLDGNYVRQEMSRMISCAAACIRHSARRRPKMSQIVRALDGDSSVDLNDGPKPSTDSGSERSPTPETQTYNTDMYNADMTKFKKMVMSSSSQDFSTNEYGATTQYGLDPNSSSSDEFRYTQQLNKNT